MSVVIDGTSGVTTPAETVQGALTTTGNTILGDASTDTLNVGNGGLVKDASGNVGVGVTPSATGAAYKSLEIGSVGSGLTSRSSGTFDINQGFYWTAGSAPIYSHTGVAAGHYRIASGVHAWETAPSGTAGNAITFTQAMTLDASGGLKTLNTIGVGNATPSASGSGITFPATQSASSNANTLDDYEEGTWTPTDASGAGLSITFNNAKYTKIGNLVFVQCSTIVYPATASALGATIGGFPFVNGTADGGATPIITSSSLANRCLIAANGTQLFFYASTGTGGSTNANLTSQTIYAFSSVYRV